MTDSAVSIGAVVVPAVRKWLTRLGEIKYQNVCRWHKAIGLLSEVLQSV